MKTLNTDPYQCPRFGLVAAFYSFFLLSSNLVGYRSLTVFQFEVSISAVFIQISFILVILIYLLYGIKKIGQLIGVSVLLNGVFAFLIHVYMGVPVHYFWLNIEQIPLEGHPFGYILIIVVCSIGYGIAATSAVFITNLLQRCYQGHFQVTKLVIAVTVASVLDLLFICPVFFYTAPDQYSALWRTLSLISVKGYTLIYFVPIGFLIKKLVSER